MTRSRTKGMLEDTSATVWRSCWMALFMLLCLVGCAPLERSPVAVAGPGSEFRTAMALLRSGETDRGEALLRELAGQRPLHVEAHRELQILALARFEHLRLLEEYRQLVEEEPDSAGAHYLRGRLLFRLEDQEREYRLARRVEPDSPWGHYGLAWVALRRRNNTAARQLLQAALRVAPNHRRSRWLLARMLLTAGKLKEAEGVLLPLVEDEPFWPEARELEVALRRQQGHSEEEWRALEALVACGGDLRRTRAWLLDLARRSRDDSLRFLVLDLAAGILPPQPRAEDLAFMAEVEHLAGRRDSARRYARAALKIGSRNPRLLALGEFNGADWLRAWSAMNERQGRRESDAITALRARIAEGPGGAALAEAFLHAGFLDQADRLLIPLEHGGPDSQAAELRQRWRRHRRVLARLDVLVRTLEEGRGAEKADSLTSFLEAAANIIEEETGYACTGKEPVLALPFVGHALDSSKALAGTVNGYLRLFNQVMFAGRLNGSRTQALVLTAFEGPRGVVPPLWPGSRPCTEVIGGQVALRSHDEAFGDSAGRALFGTYFIDMDVLMPWKARLLESLKRAGRNASTVLDTPAPLAHGARDRRRMLAPALAAEALTLRSLQLHGDLLLLDSIQRHEQGHLRDSFHYLPMWQRLIPNVLLLVRGGFSPVGVMSELEEAAALFALQQAKSPSLVLAELIRALPADRTDSPHSRGYRNLLNRFLIRLDERRHEFSGIDPGRNLFHQLHRLDEEEIRSLALELS